MFFILIRIFSVWNCRGNIIHNHELLLNSLLDYHKTAHSRKQVHMIMNCYRLNIWRWISPGQLLKMLWKKLNMAVYRSRNCCQCGTCNTVLNDEKYTCINCFITCMKWHTVHVLDILLVIINWSLIFFGLSLFRHARRYFVNLVDDQLYEVQRVMGLLAYSANTTLPPYKVSSFICLH